MSAVAPAPSAHHEDIDAAIGARIHQMLFLKRTTQTFVASRLDMTQTNISRKLRGQVKWTPGELVRIARGLGTSVGYLVGETTDPRPLNADGGEWLPDLDSNQEPAGLQLDAELGDVADLVAWRARRGPHAYRQPPATGARVTRFPSIVAVA